MTRDEGRRPWWLPSRATVVVAAALIGALRALLAVARMLLS